MATNVAAETSNYLFQHYPGKESDLWPNNTDDNAKSRSIVDSRPFGLLGVNDRVTGCAKWGERAIVCEGRSSPVSSQKHFQL